MQRQHQRRRLCLRCVRAVVLQLVCVQCVYVCVEKTRNRTVQLGSEVTLLLIEEIILNTNKYISNNSEEQ